VRVVLYSKPDCGLCDELKRDLLNLQKELQFELVERDILEDAEAFARYRYLIPVLDIEGGELLYPPHHPDIVRGALRAADGQAT